MFTSTSVLDPLTGPDLILAHKIMLNEESSTKIVRFPCIVMTPPPHTHIQTHVFALSVLRETLRPIPGLGYFMNQKEKFATNTSDRKFATDHT